MSTPLKPSRIKKTGMPPGSLIYVGDAEVKPVRITIIRYNDNHFEETVLTSSDNLQAWISNDYNVWINIDGVHDVKQIEQIGHIFELDPLSLEDILNTQTRPKYDEYDDYIFCIIKDLYVENGDLMAEQLSFVMKDRLLITFQEEEGDVFDGVRNRLRTGATKIRTRGSDYLMYALLDAIVDNYFVICEWFDKSIDELEERLYLVTGKSELAEIMDNKNEFNNLKRVMLPGREVVYAFYKSENSLIKRKTKLFIRDLMDHVVHIVETLDQSWDKVNGLIHIYLSGTNQTMNNIMKTLTIISTVFMCLSLIAGIYGMNFKHMPELEWRYGYFIVLGLMFGLAAVLLYFFRRKNWL